MSNPTSPTSRSTTRGVLPHQAGATLNELVGTLRQIEDSCRDADARRVTLASLCPTLSMRPDKVLLSFRQQSGATLSPHELANCFSESDELERTIKKMLEFASGNDSFFLNGERGEGVIAAPDLIKF